MGRRERHFSPDDQAVAIVKTQTQMWLGIVARFEHLKAMDGLRQADLAKALGVSRPQIHEWLSDPRNMTIKAAGRLLLAMDARVNVEVLAEPDASETLTPIKDGQDTKTPWRLGALVAFVAAMSLLRAMPG